MVKDTISLVLLLLVCVEIQGQNNNTASVTNSIPSTWEYEPIFEQQLPTEDDWWKSFEDACLDSLINIGIKNNYDILIAKRRIEIASASVKSVQSGYYPTLSSSVGWTKNKTSGSISNIGSINSTYFDLGLNCSWQIDVFGQIRERVKGQKMQDKVTKCQYNAVMVTLCANIATAYINLRMWQAQYNVAISHISSQKIVMDMAIVRFNSGLASLLDVSQAKMVYYSTLASLPALESSIELQINNISLLLGVYKDGLPNLLLKYSELPLVNGLVPVGVPLDLLRRRPDIVASEYTIASYAAALGVSKKDFLPILSFDGSIGFQSKNIKNIFTEDAFTYTISPKLTWTVFDGLSRKYQVITAKEQYIIAIDDYNNTVMTAINEVQNSMASYSFTLKQIASLNTVMLEAKNSVVLSIDLYKRGLSAFTNVASAQLAYFEYNNSYIEARGAALNYLIQIYEALGGGWNVDNMK